MRIISLDLLLGTPRLKRRIDAELAQLPHDIAALRANTQRLKQGMARKVTSLPALAIAASGGFVIGKIARAPHWRNAGSAITRSIWWQLLFPLALNSIQIALAPKSKTPGEAA